MYVCGPTTTGIGDWFTAEASKMKPIQDVVIVTGLSGAGKSTALRALSDTGFYCIDNLPPPLVSQTVLRM